MQTQSIRNLTIVAAGLLITGGAAWAGPVDYDATQDGHTAPSATRDTWLVDEIDQLLLTFNNDMSWHMIVGTDPISVFANQPYDKRYMLGELMKHSSDTKLIYDRLAVRAVVQVLGYDTGDLPLTDASPWMALANDRKLYALPGPPSIGGGGSGGSTGATAQAPPADPSLTSVPEPAAFFIVGLGALALATRRRRPARSTRPSIQARTHEPAKPCVPPPPA